MPAMPEYQVTRWRDLPSLVVAREGDDVVKLPLPQTFQEAIDEAAMRLGAVDSMAYLEGWVREAWTPADGTLTEVAERVVAGLEGEWSEKALAAYLDAIGPAAD